MFRRSKQLIPNLKRVALKAFREVCCLQGFTRKLPEIYVSYFSPFYFVKIVLVKQASSLAKRVLSIQAVD